MTTTISPRKRVYGLNIIRIISNNLKTFLLLLLARRWKVSCVEFEGNTCNDERRRRKNWGLVEALKKKIHNYCLAQLVVFAAQYFQRHFFNRLVFILISGKRKDIFLNLIKFPKMLVVAQDACKRSTFRNNFLSFLFDSKTFDANKDSHHALRRCPTVYFEGAIVMYFYWRKLNTIKQVTQTFFRIIKKSLG